MLITGFAPRGKHLSLRPVKPDDSVLQILAFGHENVSY